MKLDLYGINKIEHHIRPLLPSAITIPVEKDGQEFVIFISAGSPWQDSPPSDKELQNVVKEIVDKIKGGK